MNEYKNGNYLEYNKKYGYTSINTFSKSIFNISFHKHEYILEIEEIMKKSIFLSLIIIYKYKEIILG